MADWTVHLKDRGRANRSGTAGNVRDIHCCRDLSELCNKSDVLTRANCIARAKENNFSRRCSNRFATVNPQDETCRIQEQCTSRRNTSVSIVRMHYLDISELSVRLGRLKDPDSAELPFDHIC